MFLRQFILLVTCFVLAACGGAPSGGGASGKTPSVKSSSEQRPGGPYIYATIAFDSLPSQLPVNLETTEIGYIEYRFAIYFDVDDDGVLSVGDVLFEIYYAKTDDSQPEELAISSFDFKTVGLITEVRYERGPQNIPDYSYRTFDEFDISVANNALTFQVSQSLFGELKSINSSTQVYVEFSCNAADCDGSDYIPNGSNTIGMAFTQEMSNRLILDYLGDYVSSGTEDSLDIESVSIRFD